MNPLLLNIYQSTVTKYIKFRKRLDKNISSGKFKNFTRRKQSQLLHKIERLRRRVLQLQTQLKLVSAGAALSLFLQAAPAQAQTTLGPFNQNYLNNPLPPPLPFMEFAAPAYVDIDGDADLDLIVWDEYTNYLRYFKNIGTQTKSYFLEIKHQNAAEYPFFNLSEIDGNRNNYVPAFADIDNDGDFDMLIGTDKYQLDDEGKTYFFRNVGTATAPDFVHDDSGTNPFSGVITERLAHPTFVDFDGDGDKDLLLGGYYDETTLLRYYKNTGTATAPSYVLDQNAPGIGSLLLSINGDYSGYSAPNAFADLDQDGDLDFFFSEYGEVHYRRNDGGAFPFANETARPNQTGPWVPNAANPGASTGNPFHSINPTIPNKFAFADLDHDGDLDLSISYYTDNPPYQEELRPLIYYENVGRGVFQVRESVISPVDGVDVGEESNASFADIDSDGDLDVLAAGSISYTSCPDNCYDYGRTFVTVLRNNNGTFVDVSEEEDDRFYEIPLLDNMKMKLMLVDNDAIPEMVVPFFDSNPPISGKIKYFKLEAGHYIEKTGTQNPFNSIQIVGRLINLDLGDLNGDNLPDLILGVADDKMQAYKNTGTAANPVFTRESSWETGFTFNQYFGANPKLLDLDNDGDLDIIVGKYDNVWYYENTGTSTAPSFVLYDELNANNPFEAIDINDPPIPNFNDVDKDGDQDLIFGDGSGQFQYFENQNPAAVTTINASELTGLKGTPTPIDPALTVADTDGDAIVRAIVRIQNFQPGKEVLAFTVQAGITGNFNATTGVLTFTGKATAAAYQALLRSVTHNFTGTVPGGKIKEGKIQSITRTISIEVLDSDLTTPILRTRSIVVSAPNVAPVITPTPITAATNSVSVNILPLITDADGNFIPSISTITIIQQPVSGAVATLDFISSSEVTLHVDYDGITFTGTDQLQIQACDDAGACTTSVIAIQVDAAAEIIVYNAFSPNAGDQINSFFNIRHIEVVSPKNKVTIYNRWGDAVSEITDYNNTTRKFEGQSDKGKELPTGTYFYKIEVTGKTITGYLSLKR